MSKLPGDALEIEVFQSGDYGEKGSFSQEDLNQVAADYSADRHEAPVTLDHLQQGPAEGWVKSLRCVGTRLLASLSGLSPKLRSLIGDGQYKKRSIELYREFEETGRPYLKAVSFLGAAAPQVKGLADPLFAEEAQGVVMFFDEEPSSLEEQREEPFGETAKQRLIDRTAWNPKWEDDGLVDVFSALGDGEESQQLMRLLESQQRPVEFNETPRSNLELINPLAGYVGEASPESIARHRQALQLQAQEPTLSYTEALSRAVRL